MSHTVRIAALLSCVALCASERAPGARAPRSDLEPGDVVYGVVPPLFGDAPLEDTAARLDELKALGVDVLWLTPVNQTDDLSAISYATTDFFALRPDFGTERELRALVDGAHRRGMKVLLDLAPNHTSSGHRFYRDAEARGPRSRRHGYYVRDARGAPQHYFDWVNLKNLDYGNPEVQRHVTAAFKHWLQRFDVDGFRVDAAWGVRQRSPEFWPKLVRELEAVKPDVILVAEASARDPYYAEAGFDAVYDWSDVLGQWAWQGAFDDLETVGPRLHEALSERGTPAGQVLRFLNNNDTGARFISRHGVDVTRVAAVLLHLVPGIPVVFTGDEIGAEYEPYADPPPLRWSDPHGLRPLYKRLAELREQPAFARGDFVSLPPKASGSAYAFARDAGAGQQALVVLNFGPEQTLEVPLPGRLAPFAASVTFADALTGARAEVRVAEGTLRVRVPALTALVLVPR